MKQALHIFRKDIRYLRFEILGLLILTAVFAAGGLWLADILTLAAVYVIARLVHAETIPGDRQFWLTRPYRPVSLCGAKLLFIVAFISVPVLIAQAVLAVRLDFPLSYEIPGLLWTQVLIFFVAALPVVALATVTVSIIPFISTVLVLAVIMLVGARGLPGIVKAHVSIAPLPVEWIGDCVFGAAISCLAVTVILWQYRDRRTLFSRVFGVVTFYVALAIYLWLPASLPLAVETWFSKEPKLAAPVRVSVDLSRRRGVAALVYDRQIGNKMEIPVPLVLTGLAAGLEAKADDSSISFEWPGRTWEPAGKSGITAHSSGESEAVFDALVSMDPRVFKAMRQAPMIVRGSVYITLFGEPESRTIPLLRGRINVQDGLQCWADDFKGEITQMRCQSFFSWPSRLVYARGAGEENDFSNSLVSYSPFPAGLTLEPLEMRWTEGIKAKEATIVTKKPLVHFRREFELRDVRLADFERPPLAPPRP